jgi:hypothetical protein
VERIWYGKYMICKGYDIRPGMGITYIIIDIEVVYQRVPSGHQGAIIRDRHGGGSEGRIGEGEGKG